MNKNQIKVHIGNIGEVAVQRQFNSDRSEDWYDPEKDGMIGDQTYEVKTFRLNNGTNSFWVGQNATNTQWSKIENVDRLFFIKVPEYKDELATLFECHDHRKCWFREKTNKGLPIRAFPITSCEELSKLTPEESIELYNNSKKLSKHKRFTK